MARSSAEDVERTVRESEVRFVQLWFTDLLGNLKSVEIPAREVSKALDEGIGFDGSSIHGFARIDESDMLLHPDPGTFAILPWENVGRLICDIALPGGEPYPGDPRLALKRALETRKLRFVVRAVYPGTKFEDLCISELAIYVK